MSGVPTAGKGSPSVLSPWNSATFKSEERCIKLLLIFLIVFVLLLFVSVAYHSKKITYYEHSLGSFDIEGWFK